MKESSTHTQSGEKLFNRYFVIVWFSTLCIYFGHVMMNSTLTLYTASLGYDASVNGLVGIPYAVLAIAGRILWGKVCDKKSRRLALACSTFIFGVCVWLFGHSTALWALMLFRGMHGFGYGGANTSMTIANVDVTPPSKRQEGIGILFVANAITFALGSYIVLALSKDGSYGPVIAAISGLLLLGVVLALFCNYEKQAVYQARRAAETVAAQEKGIRRYLEPSAIVPGLILLTLVAGATGASYYALKYAKDMDFANPSLYFTLAAVVMAVCNLSQAKIVKRVGPVPVLVVTFALFALSLVLQAVTDSAAAYYIQGAVFGMQQGFGWPVATALTMARIPYNRRGAASSTACMMADLGAGIGGVIYGQVVAHIGYGAFYLVLAGIQVAGLLITLFVVRRTQADKGHSPVLEESEL